MGDPSDLAAIARLIGEPARAAMLARLLDGGAATAGELAREAGISPQTASGHLSQLLDGRVVSVVAQGRHRYYRLASADVASALEMLSILRPSVPRATRVPEPLRFARTCYNHLAGRLGVAVADALVSRGYLLRGPDVFTVTREGRHFLAETLGVQGEPDRAGKGAGRTCLDWSERRVHIGGELGCLLLQGLLAKKWLAKATVPRALRLTVAGRRALEGRLGVRLDAGGAQADREGR